jgi:hypothetical protein
MSMSQTTTPSSSVEFPAIRRDRVGSLFNLRVLVFITVVLSIFGALGYLWWSVAGTHGIIQKGDAYQVDLKSMSTFPFDQIHGTIEDVPQRYRELDGKKVILIGEMWAPNAASDRLNQFELVYSIAKCCFSGPPQIQHFVQATTVKGPVPYYSGLVRVTGTLKVEITKAPDGKITGVYHLSVDQVEPV